MHLIILRIYAVLLIVHGAWKAASVLLPEEYLAVLPPAPAWLYPALWISCLAFYILPLGPVIGYGLLRRRAWARIGVMAVMLTWPIRLLTDIMWWGLRSISLPVAVPSFLVAVATITYFSRSGVRALFPESTPFRLRSLTAALVCVVFLLSSVEALSAIGIKVFFARAKDEPFFVSPPEVLPLERRALPQDRYRRVHLFGTGLSLPRTLEIHKVTTPHDPPGSWDVMLLETGDGLRTFVTIGNASLHSYFKNDLPRGIFVSDFEFEGFFHTSNWNPVILVLRMIVRPGAPGTVETLELHGKGLRGFLLTWKEENRLSGTFSLYAADDSAYLGGTLVLEGDRYTRNDLLAILASVSFGDAEPAEAYAEHGRRALHEGDILQAQFDFLNAYYRVPENPDYAYLLAHALAKDGIKDYQGIAELLRPVAADHAGARALLEVVEHELAIAPPITAAAVP